MKPYATALIIVTVLLTAYNFFSLAALSTTSVGVQVLNPLTVSIAPSKTWVNVGEVTSVTFAASGGVVYQDGAAAWLIIWGDGVVQCGGTPSASFPECSGQPSTVQGYAAVTVSHSYSKLGTYSLTAKAKDRLGYVGSTTITITVGSTPVTISCDASPKIGVKPITATVTCTGGGGSGSYNWFYTWGDGSAKEQSATPSGTQTRSHTFTAAGSFTITVNNQESNTAYCQGGVCPLGIWQSSYGVADYSQLPQIPASIPQPSAKSINWSDPLILLNFVMGVASVAVYTRGGRSV